MRRALRVALVALWGCQASEPGGGATPPPPSSPPPAAFAPHRLTLCSISEISGDRPVFRRLLPEGDIAWYGLLLRSKPDPAIVRYLLSRERDGLWEYQAGYGATGEDTALVVDGLMAAGGVTDAVARALERLVEVFYRPAGYFVTVGAGRAPYWRGPDVETNAHIGSLLWRGAATRYARHIAAAARYVVSAQEPTGEWKPKWYPSRVLAGYYAVRFLAPQGAAYAAAVSRATAWFRRSQQADGSWGGSAMDTAAAVLALREAGYAGPAVTLGETWLRRWRASSRPAREPVLQYWIEAGSSREFYVCFETGEISAAWVALAEEGTGASTAGPEQ